MFKNSVVKASFILLLCILAMSIKGNSQESQGPVKVEVRKENGNWKLYRGGKPYYIKGVGGQSHLDLAVAVGANSVRTWAAPEAEAVLDSANKKGLTVLFGLWVGVQRQGFDYNDSKAVAAQLAKFTAIVKKFKDNPAILMWGIGNETDLDYTNYKVWNAINDIAEMIHRVDPNHPTMTVTAGLDVAEVQLIKKRAPAIDVYGINTYGEILDVKKEIRAYGWDKPYVITEWGPTGHWEVPKTKWGAPIEQTSTQKAAAYKERYEKGIIGDKQMCLGSYVFLWGHKQETTATWYGIFLPDDSTTTGVIDVLEKEWSGKEPKDHAPEIASLTINGKDAYSSVYLKPGDIYTAVADASDQDNDSLTYKWVMLPESTDIKTGGDAEAKPKAIKFRTKSDNGHGTMTFVAPNTEGAYRMFIYIYDGRGKAATANIPFYVQTQPSN